MTNLELILNMLAEAAATEVSIVQQPVGFSESAEIAVIPIPNRINADSIWNWNARQDVAPEMRSIS